MFKVEALLFPVITGENPWVVNGFLLMISDPIPFKTPYFSILVFLKSSFRRVLSTSNPGKLF